MRTKEEKERMNKKYGEVEEILPGFVTEVAKKMMEDILNMIKASGNRIVSIDTDCVWYKHHV